MFATTDDTEFLSFLSGADGSGQPALGAEQLVIVRDQVSVGTSSSSSEQVLAVASRY
jgi:hypothetical protein